MTPKVTPRATAIASMPRADGERRDRYAARALIFLALIIEVQSPRLEGNYRLNIAVFAFVGTLLLLSRAQQTVSNLSKALSGSLAFLAAYCLWCLASLMWTVDPIEAALDVALLILSLLLAVSYALVPLRIMAEEFVKVSLALAAISWAMILVVPRVAVLPDIVWRLNGPMQHSQRLALVMGAALVVLTVLKLHERSASALPVPTFASYVLLIATLVATQTRAFTVFTLLVLWVVVFGSAQGRQRVLLGIGFALGVLLVFENRDYVFSAFERDGSNALTLTGRTVIWENSIMLIRDNPVVGYGFSSFYTDLTRHFFSSGYSAPHAHNTWINATFETGLIGATILTIFMVATLRYGSISKPTYASALMLLAMLCGATGIVFGGKVSTLWVLVAAFVAQSAAQIIHFPSGLQDHFLQDQLPEGRDVNTRGKYEAVK